MIHYTERDLLDPNHSVEVHLVGAGGTGSLVLAELGRIDHALRQLGHPGLHLTCFDPDEVSEANIGRQLFSPADIGENKARILVERVNRFYGLSWESRPRVYEERSSGVPKILITAVDTASARIAIGNMFQGIKENKRPYYWLDFGNRQNDGQTILGTMQKIGQPDVGPSCSASRLATVIEMYPNLAQEDRSQDQGPSCSLGEALNRQDLFINRVVASFGCTILWKLFRNARISVCGCFVNLESLRVNPLSVEHSSQFESVAKADQAA